MNTTDRTQSPHRRRIGELIAEFPWLHLALGLLGNALFFAGSILFFWEATKTTGIWLFVLGSLFMLIGSLGELFVKIEKRRRGAD